MLLPNLNDLIADNPGWLDEAVSPKEAARVINRTPKALSILRVRGGGPVFIRCGKHIRYTRRDLFEWLAKSRVRSTCDHNGGHHGGER